MEGAVLRFPAVKVIEKIFRLRCDEGFFMDAGVVVAQDDENPGVVFAQFIL